MALRIVVFGLSISSSWGNGHATLWRGLCKALGRRGHRVVFFEKNVAYYAQTRDSLEFEGCDLRLYASWGDVVQAARRELSAADAAMVTSYCPDGAVASDLVLDSAVPMRIFYDLDAPITLARIEAGQEVEYLPGGGLGDFHLVLSYTGGAALNALRSRLGARCVAPLYGSVDPEIHAPATAMEEFRGDLSYLGTYAEDRQEALTRLLLEPARRLPEQRFVIGGAQYPDSFPWSSNIYFVRHLPPALHPALYASSRTTLNVTRAAMAQMGYCPSGRLFEAAACGVPILTDAWEGLEEFFRPGEEILVCQSSDDTVSALSLSDGELRRIAGAARERTLTFHTATARAKELEDLIASPSRVQGAEAIFA